MEPDHPMNSSNVDDLRDMVGSLAVTVDKLSSNVDLMVKDSTLTRQAMLDNTKALSRSKRQNTLLRVALVSSLLLFVGGAVVVWRDFDETSCVKKWAVATSDRSKSLSSTASSRVTDLYGALGAASGGSLQGVGALPSRADEERFVYEARKRYPLLVPGTKADLAKQSLSQLSSTYYLVQGLDANSSYIAATIVHPIPQSPFNCSAF